MSSSCRISSVPKGAQQLTQLRDQEGKKKPSFDLLKEEKGRGRAIKCFCFVYKERNFQEAPSQGGVHLSPNYEQQQSQAKERRGKLEGPRDPQALPQTEATNSPPPNASTPGDPSGMRKGVYTQLGVALGWVGKGIIYPQQRWVARGQGAVVA